MPELPEVEVVRRDLAAEVAGRRVESVTVTGARSVRRQHPAEFAARLTGAVVGTPGRVGKYLLLPLEDGACAGETLVVHLRMSGQLRLNEAGDRRLRHTHVVLGLSGARELRFVDPRTFGEMFVTASPEADLRALGPDVLDPSWSAADLAVVLAARTAKLKALLLDQRRLAGLGNIYSDEVLFAAGLRFDRIAGSLSAGEVAGLHAAIRATLEAAIEHRGSSLADAQYVDLFGRPGRYQAHHHVYAREGHACPRCTAPVLRVRFAGRSTFLCGSCQPDAGFRTADRRRAGRSVGQNADPS